VPFDLPECESEIVAGYHTEYSSLKYAMFPMGEYIAMCAMAAIATHMFLGGIYLPTIGGVDLTYWAGHWTIPAEGTFGITGDYWHAIALTGAGLATTLTFLVKMFLVILFFMWVRATEPRFRYDQLMAFGWKGMLPVGLVLVLLTAVILVLVPDTEAAKSVAEVTALVAR